MSTALTLHSQHAAVVVVPPSIQEAAALIQNPELPVVAAYQPDELSACLVLPITGVAFLLGHKNSLKSADDLELLATALARVVKRRFAGFKLAEVTEALQRGASGEYHRKPDELLLPSLDHFTHWLSSYQQGCRAAALRALAQAAEAKPPPKRSSPRGRRNSRTVSGVQNTTSCTRSTKPFASLRLRGLDEEECDGSYWGREGALNSIAFLIEFREEFIVPVT